VSGRKAWEVDASDGMVGGRLVWMVGGRLVSIASGRMVWQGCGAIALEHAVLANCLQFLDVSNHGECV